ncbi:hypothetical protein HBI67_137860 [Parastagonospora nodorum]|nr:hypothetical protein HBI66_197670 [Parastagonospora nodorum]KAH6063260.1 hypothetical protein HBI67_137860 [Parastagonospora nodorum]
MFTSLTLTALPKNTQKIFVTITSTLPADFPASSLSLRPHRSPVPHPPSPSTLSTSIRQSTYPRPSPPGFLYPDPIVPRAVQNQLQHAYTTQCTDMTGHATSNVIWYLPYGLEVLIFTVMVIGLAWAGRVFLLTFPPRTWRAKKEGEKEERRPVNKPSKYAGRDAHGRGNTSAREGMEEHVELKHRRQPEHQRSKSSPAPAIRFNIPAAIDSPPNPFLYPPSPTQYLSPPHALQPRTSSEWLRQHAAFFSATSSSYSHASSVEYDQEYDIEALEAGTAPRSPSLKAHKKNLSWADLSLERMEGAVSGWMGKVARWTDDDGDEGVLLPVVNGRQQIKAQ